MDENLTKREPDGVLTWPTASRFTDLWNGRHQIRNWWWVFPIAALVHAQLVAGWSRPRSFGKLPVRVTLRSGHRISCRANEVFQIAEVFISGDYENPDISYPEARTVLDIGANIGVSTIWLSEHCPLARIFAVEPSSRRVRASSEISIAMDSEVASPYSPLPLGEAADHFIWCSASTPGFLTLTANLTTAAKPCGQRTSKRSSTSSADMWTS